MPKRFVVPASDFSDLPHFRGDIELAEALTVAARQLHDTQTPDSTMQVAVRLAVRLLPGAEHAGISVMERDGHRRCVAWTDEVVRTAEESGDGPPQASYRDQLWQAPVVRLTDGETEDGGRPLADVGLRSALALRLRAEKRRLTVLTAYAAKPRAFDADATRIGRLYTAHVSLALDSATVREQLTEAMRTRDLIGQATGILMERRDIDAAEAFDSLVRTSQRENVKLRDIARRIVDTKRAT
ncbi:GAF and ANTAR domain-containing protein [Streptomyces sp. SID10815]|uniref:GAF and ANTAR domain-containing protein n=1 Tax=Streptomyces sp. SID10815 TaxID=2706027 RepID=UPI0013C60761|nr:GAF and ANTAR domain-containing protein [Streptomyces sp. SID10815]NEA48603.1 GAF and ANTAR domain-containing protein [Streptomyces sp. SID10815]